MQKVEGSSPFSRLRKALHLQGLSSLHGPWVVRLRRVVTLSPADGRAEDNVDRVREKGREDHPEGIEVTVPHSAEGDVHRRGMRWRAPLATASRAPGPPADDHIRRPALDDRAEVTEA